MGERSVPPEDNTQQGTGTHREGERDRRASTAAAAAGRPPTVEPQGDPLVGAGGCGVNEPGCGAHNTGGGATWAASKAVGGTSRGKGRTAGGLRGRTCTEHDGAEWSRCVGRTATSTKTASTEEVAATSGTRTASLFRLPGGHGQTCRSAGPGGLIEVLRLRLGAAPWWAGGVRARVRVEDEVQLSRGGLQVQC